MKHDFLRDLKNLEELVSKSSRTDSLDQVASLAKKALPLAEALLATLKGANEIKAEILYKGETKPFLDR